MEQSDDEVLDPPCELAKTLGLSVRTLDRWRYESRGPEFIKISESCVRYRRREWRKWVQARLRRSTSDPGPGRNGADGI